MSRCFPFPPPGYEKKPRSGDSGDLLTKEKHKERKHKKEKRDKEKGEGKERKDKDRNKDKHREKKDRKEKHKDRKKDKDKNSASEEKKSEQQTEGFPDDKLRDVSQEAEEVKIFKFTEELGRRIRDEKYGAANPMVENSTITTQRRIEGMGASMAKGKEGLTDTKMGMDDPFGTVQRRNKSVTPPLQRSIESIGTASAMEKQRGAIGMGPSMSKGKEGLTDKKMAMDDPFGTVQRRNKSVTPPFQRSIESIGTASAMEKQRGAIGMGASTAKGKEDLTDKKMAMDPFGTVQRRNESVTPPLQRSIESIGTASAMEKQRGAIGKEGVAGSKMVGNLIGSTEVGKGAVMGTKMAADLVDIVQRRTENATSSVQRRVEGTGITSAVEKQKPATTGKVPNLASTEQRRNHFTGRPADNFNSTVQRRTEGTVTANSIQKERGASYNMASNFTEKTQRRNDGMGKPVENLITSSDQRKIEGMGTAPTVEKERVKGCQMVPNIVSTELRNDGMGRAAEKDADKKSQGEEKIKENKAEVGKGARCEDGEWNAKKSKWKDKNRDKEKEKEEKKREKGEHKRKHKEHDKPSEVGKKGQVDNLFIKPLAPLVNNVQTAGAADGNTKKRKEFEMNGFSHETDARPSKLSRTNTSYSQTPMENGGSLGLSHIAPPCSSIRLGAINNIKKAETILDNKENKANGKAQAQRSAAALRPSVAVHSMGNGEVSLRPPHPDSKYLSTIYSVPRMEEWPDQSDDQEWLFSRDQNPRPKTNREADGSHNHVWAEALHIESADVFALPYVIPF